MVTNAMKALALPLLVTASIMADIRLNHIRCCISRLPATLLVVAYICPGPSGTEPSLRGFVGISSSSRISRPVKQSALQSWFFNRVSTDRMLDKTGHKDSKRERIDHWCSDCVKDLTLGCTIVNCLLYRRIKHSNLKSFNHGSTQHSSDHVNYFRAQARFHRSARIYKEAYDSVLYLGRSTSDLFVQGTLQSGPWSGVRGVGPQGWHSSDKGRSAMASNESSPVSLGSGVATFSKKDCNDWGANGELPPAFTALDRSAILQPSQSIRSRLLASVASLTHLHRMVFIVDTRLTEI